MISLAERRGRSAMGHYDLPTSALTTTITSSAGPHGHRQRSAPPRSTTTAEPKPNPCSESRPPSPLTLQLTSRTSQTSTTSSAVISIPEAISGRIRALDEAFIQLYDGVHDLIAEDPDWLEEQYGLGRRLRVIHAEHKAVVDLIIDLHIDLHEWRQRSEHSVAQHDEQSQALQALDFQSWTSPDQLKQTITSLERELIRLDPGRSLDVCDSRLGKFGPIPRLIALRFQRQDDLLFVMRRRLAQMSLDQPLVECMDQFRSLRDLLDELDRLRQRNAQLQLRECRFQQSVLLRRRPLHRCSMPLMQTLIIALQNELSAVHNLLAELELDQHPLRELFETEMISASRPTKDATVDLDALYAQLTGRRTVAIEDSGPIEPIDDDLQQQQQQHQTQTPGRRSNSRSSLQQLRDALRMAEFASDSASRAAGDALADLERDIDMMQNTIGDQHDLVSDLSDRLRRQHMLNMKLTTIVYELLRRSDRHSSGLVSSEVSNERLHNGSGLASS